MTDASQNRGKTLINDWNLAFDTGDSKNGSLYICHRGGADAEAALGVAVDQLREAGLWSGKAPSEVQESQKSAYAEQLRFLDEQSVGVDGVTLLLARYDHPRYPSDEDRFRAWCRRLAGDKN